MARKIQPVQTNFDDEFLDAFSVNTLGNIQTQKKSSALNDITEIIDNNSAKAKAEAPAKNYVKQDETSYADDEFNKEFKSTQIVIRASEREKREIQTYFMKHGLSISKGIKIAIRYLQKQESENEINLTEVGIM